VLRARQPVVDRETIANGHAGVVRAERALHYVVAAARRDAVERGRGRREDPPLSPSPGSSPPPPSSVHQQRVTHELDNTGGAARQLE
jgi:hypothetical protein